MKGIILSGGHATRLRPLTKMTSKQLLPVYDKPMIYYPLYTLLNAGIKDILIILAPEYAGHYLNLLGSGKEFGEGVRITYEIQDAPRGLADAFIVGQTHIGDDSVAMILGDNIFEHDFTEDIRSFQKGGRIFALEVPDPERFGVVEFDEAGKVLSIEEKPKSPKSNYCIPGLYMFDNRVIQFAKEVEPSERGEVEITSLHQRYLDLGELDVRKVHGKWFDAGTFDSLLAAGNFVAEQEGKIGCQKN
jgi:glucose-1-phosphate thymidylyltransferase